MEEIGITFGPSSDPDSVEQVCRINCRMMKLDLEIILILRVQLYLQKLFKIIRKQKQERYKNWISLPKSPKPKQTTDETIGDNRWPSVNRFSFLQVPCIKKEWSLLAINISGQPDSLSALNLTEGIKIAPVHLFRHKLAHTRNCLQCSFKIVSTLHNRHAVQSPGFGYQPFVDVVV